VAAAPGKRVFVEIKEPVPADTPAKVLAAIKQQGIADRAIVTSFDQSLLDPVRKLDPGQAVGFISKSFGSTEINYPSQYLLITSGAVTAGQMAEAHKAGKKVYVWTVDEPRAMESFLRMGVDGIISNQYRTLAETEANLTK
jgi:glycerophosphoryl diester phosphodiesterase